LWRNVHFNVQCVVFSCTSFPFPSCLFFLSVTPLDVVKTRLQAQQRLMISKKCYLYCNGLMDHLCPCAPNGNGATAAKKLQFTGTIDAFAKISRHEGVKSLWSGLSPTLVLALPTTMIYFVTYEQLRQRLKDRYMLTRPGETEIPLWIPLVSGASARVFAVTLVNPLELVRTKMQSEKLSYREVGTAYRSMLKTQGVTFLWRGLFPTILRDVPFSGIYWTSYETLKKKFNVEYPTFWFSFAAGAISGSIAACLTVPFDVVKTHQQIEFGEKVLMASKYLDYLPILNPNSCSLPCSHPSKVDGHFQNDGPYLPSARTRRPVCRLGPATLQSGPGLCHHDFHL
jgi:solute carrier family 25, member 39/40